MNAEPSAAPSGTATTSTGKPVHDAKAWSHGLDPGAAAGGDDPLGRDRVAREIEVVTDHETGRLVARRDAHARDRA